MTLVQQSTPTDSQRTGNRADLKQQVIVKPSSYTAATEAADSLSPSRDPPIRSGVTRPWAVGSVQEPPGLDGLTLVAPTLVSEKPYSSCCMSSRFSCPLLRFADYR